MVEWTFVGKLRRAAAVFVLLVGISLGYAANSSSSAIIDTGATSVAIPGVHNAFRASEKVYSGSQPEGDAAFAALAKLGVKIIVSVDGSKPDVEAARQHGLRYVHLPYGYDGIPTNRAIELAKLALETEGPFFVHCHHGLHRGPAAVAVMCEAAEGWTTNGAVQWLRQAGTATDYPGLYRAVGEFRPPTGAELTAVKNLPEITTPSSLVEAMVQIDGHYSWLKQSMKAGWKTPPGQADISPAHEATMLWEQLQEIARTEDTKRRPADYGQKLADAVGAANSLRKLARETDNIGGLEAELKRIGATCTACHKRYRNE
jgi:protein tyrosine phosphatase (PTP) superfamily phosphohydrolase (DUF442 family)